MPPALKYERSSREVRAIAAHTSSTSTGSFSSSFSNDYAKFAARKEGEQNNDCKVLVFARLVCTHADRTALISLLVSLPLEGPFIKDARPRIPWLGLIHQYY